ncbi:MAG: hypothetical protein WEB04_12115 [Dehalococcoidia bacterium]
MEKFQALGMGEKLILIAGVVLLISSFLPWYRIDLGPFGDVSRNGWQSPGAIWSIIAVFIGVGMSGAVALTAFSTVALPSNVGGQSWARIYLGGAAIALLCLIIKFLNENSYLSFGYFLGLIAVLALAAGAFLMFRDEGGTLPGLPSSGGPPA